MGRGREPWERSEAGGVNDNERHLRHSPVSSPTEELRKDKRRSDDSGRRERTRPGFLSRLPLSSLLLLSFRSSSVGLETGEWRRCRSLSLTPPASLRSHGSRPRPTRHSHFQAYTQKVEPTVNRFLTINWGSHTEI